MDGDPRLLEGVLCHEAAHVVAWVLAGPEARPHGAEWRELVRAAGFEPRIRRAGDAGDAGDVGDAGDAAASASRRASGRFAYEHRCPVCQAVRYANTARPRWQCLECGEAGLEGALEIRRVGPVVMSGSCPFCHPDPAWVFHEGEGVVALWDAFPASPGHAPVVPRRHVAGWFDATREEQREVLDPISCAARSPTQTSAAPTPSPLPTPARPTGPPAQAFSSHTPTASPCARWSAADR